jgi:2-polyprenyl-3-methyl-5-hydroxy-6-metoxy-1,4-benzoquinol methylase
MKNDSTPVPKERQQLAPRVRRSSLWAYLREAPLHDFAIRDQILYTMGPCLSLQRALEIGPGSGITAFTVSQWVRELTVVEVAEVAVEELRRKLRAIENVHVCQFDLSVAGLASKVDGGYEVAYALDVLEYVPRPDIFLANVAQVLAPGGELFLTFPNVPPPKGDGVTYFSSVEEVERLAGAAGYSRCEVYPVQLGSFARSAYRLLHEFPLRSYRRVRQRPSAGRPQTYEQTWAFQQQKRFVRFKPLLHAYWKFVAMVLRWGGPVWRRSPDAQAILGRQVVIRAWK